MIEYLYLIKLIIAITLVIGLAFVAENTSPKIAGILSGYPTGSALTLFFFGLEVNPKFAAESAVYNMIGLTASLSFLYIYYIASKYFNKFNILFSSISAILGFGLITWILSLMELNRFVAIAIPILFTVAFIYIFKNIEDIGIKKKAKLNYTTLFIRAFFSGLIILSISNLPKFVSSNLAGLFSAFPTTSFPLMIIIHYTYSKQHVHSIIKNVPVGMFSLIIYSLTVSITYPIVGIYLGTIISYIAATGFLLIYTAVKNKLKKHPRKPCIKTTQ